LPETECPDWLNFKIVTPGSLSLFTSQVPVRFNPWAWASGETGNAMNTTHNAAIIRRFFLVFLLGECYGLVELR